MVRALLSAGASFAGTLGHLGLLKVIVNARRVAVTSTGTVAKPQVQHARRSLGASGHGFAELSTVSG
jgi:hypothetical protein